MPGARFDGFWIRTFGFGFKVEASRCFVLPEGIAGQAARMIDNLVGREEEEKVFRLEA